MKRLTLCLLALALALLLPVSGLAEDWTIEQALPEGGAAIAVSPAEWVDEPVEEYEMELGPSDDDFAGGRTELLAPEGATEQAPAEQTPAEQAPADAQQAPAEGEQASETGDAPEQPSIFGPAIAEMKITVSKDTSKAVYMGLAYRIRLKDDSIKSVTSSAPKIAKASKSGAIKLRKPGKASLTINTADGKKRVLKLEVKPVPAPTEPSLKLKKERFKLSWKKAEFATGYLVQVSADGDEWADLQACDADARSLNVTAAVDGETWFRIVAILGDKLGGASDPVSALAPPTDVKVVCEEEYYYGPTDRLNVTWSAVPGATKYEVYRASLPSNKYKLVGTTKKTLFADTRAATELYAYRVRPVSGDMQLRMSEPVTLWSGMQDNVLPPKDKTSDSGILLLVNKQAQVVTAYIKDADGKYTLPLRHMICSTGRVYDRTKNGTYKLTKRKGEWYTYAGPSGDTIRWPSVYRSGYYFHSPLYNRDHSIRGYTVDRLGGRASAGCIRLKVRDAEWVYKNCVNGSTVYICDGKEIKKLNKALRPKTVKVKGF